MNSGTTALFDPSPVHAIVGRRRLISRATAVFTAVALFLATIFILAWLDVSFALVESVRIWFVGIAGIFALALAAQWWWKKRESQNAEAVVCEMEAADRDGGQRLRTAWELASKGIPPLASDEQKHFSSKLLLDAQQEVSSGKWGAMMPASGMVRWLSVCGLIIAGMYVVAGHWPDFRLALRRVLMPMGAPAYTSITWETAPGQFDDRHPPRLAVTLSGRQAVPVLHVLEAGSSAWQTRLLTALADGRRFDTMLTGLTGDFHVYVTAGDGSTLPLHMEYRPIPRLEEAKVTIHYPDYTGLAPEDRQGGDVSVVEGSTLAWTFRFNTPPDRVEWRLSSDTDVPQVVPLQATGATETASWKMPLGKYSGVLSVFDKDGATIDSWKYEIAGVVDKMPVVELLEPTKDLQATSVTELPVRIRARDDFGVAEIGLIMEAGGQTIWTLEKVIEERDQRDVIELTRAMLETVPLTIRDNVKLYAYALDHKPRGGPRSVSALRAIDIRDFKKLERYANGKKPPVNPEWVIKLNALIIAQRVVVSDCHVLKEEARDEAAEGISTKCQSTGLKQQDVMTKTGLLLGEWESDPDVPRDDVALLGTAQAQMEEAGRYLARTLVEQAHPASDRALSSLLQLRKHLMRLIGDAPGNSDGDPIDIKKLEELAKEAERLAEEEKSVRGQLMPANKKPVTSLESSRRQQEVAVADGGELFAAIVAHPKKNEQMEKLMAAAEKALREADERLHTAEHLNALPPLAIAENYLRDLADFIRAMNEEKLADTLQKLASKAQDDAEKSGSDGKGASASQQPAESKSGEGQSGKGAGKKLAGQKPQEMAGHENAPAKKKAAQEAARHAGLADEILKTLGKQSASGDNDGKAPGNDGKKEGGNSGMSAADLAALRKRADTEALAKDLQLLAQRGDKPEQGAGPGAATDGKQDGKGMAGRLEKMAQELNAEATRLKVTRLASLAELRDKAKALRDKKATDPATRQAAEDKKLIAQLIAQGFRPGQVVNINGKTVTIPTKPSVGSGEKPGVGQNKPGPGSPRFDIERFVVEAQRLGDDPITGMTKQLETEDPLLTISAMEGIIGRLDLLMATLPGGAVPQAAQARIPEAHRREIEAYFRNLSDDFGNESK